MDRSLQGKLRPLSDSRSGRRLVVELAASALARLVLNTARRFAYPFGPALARGLDVPLTRITSLVALNQGAARLRRGTHRVRLGGELAHWTPDGGLAHRELRLALSVSRSGPARRIERGAPGHFATAGSRIPGCRAALGACGAGVATSRAPAGGAW